MILSKERLLNEAENTQFRPEILEKVIILMRILEGIHKDELLKRVWCVYGDDYTPYFNAIAS